jgi:hypothetical protein
MLRRESHDDHDELRWNGLCSFNKLICGHNDLPHELHVQTQVKIGSAPNHSQIESNMVFHRKKNSSACGYCGFWLLAALRVHH